jgi:hypothetical protein
MNFHVVTLGAGVVAGVEGAAPASQTKQPVSKTNKRNILGLTHVCLPFILTSFSLRLQSLGYP